MTDELVERVARAIYTAYSCGWDELDENEKEGFRVEARAAIRVVVEECARVAERNDDSALSSDVADAIRALAKE